MSNLSLDLGIGKAFLNTREYIKGTLTIYYIKILTTMLKQHKTQTELKNCQKTGNVFNIHATES